MAQVRQLVSNRSAALEENPPALDSAPLMDELIYLMGRPPLKGFLRVTAPEDEFGRKAVNRASLREEWLAANRHVKELEQTEAGWVDNAVIGKLPAHLESLREKVLNDPIFQGSFDTLPVEIGMVELDRLVVYQKHINLTYARQLKQKLGPNPGDEEIFRTALPFDHPQPPSRWAKIHGNSYVFLSPSNDMRFLGPIVLKGAQIEHLPRQRGIVGVVGLMVGFGSNFLNVIQSRGRLILNNGSHRAYALRDLGITHVPCIIEHANTPEEFKLVDAAELKRHPDLYLEQPRPSVLKDYFDPQLRKIIPTPRELRQIKIDFETEEIFVPAM